MRRDPPSNLTLDVGVSCEGKPITEGPSIPAADLGTPETEDSTHYF